MRYGNFLRARLAGSCDLLEPGGWSDTPPIAYELGGAVLGLAVRVDGRRPIGAKARRILEPELWLAAGPRQDEMTMKIVCRSLNDLQDYCQPHAPGQDL